MATYVKPTDWQAGSPIYYVLALDNRIYDVHNAGSGYSYDLNATYALTSIDNNTIRFEVRAGDNNWYDEGSGVERSEIATQESFEYREPMHVSYDFALEPGAPNTARWMILGQIHTKPPEGISVSPPVAIVMVGEKMTVVARYTDAAGNFVAKTVYADTTNIVRGHSYDMDIKAIFDPDGGGRLVIVRDGVVIVDYEGPLGYDFEGGVFWKEGVYRSPAPETTAATFSNLRISQGDMVDIPPKGEPHVHAAEAPTLVLDQGQAQGDGALLQFEGDAEPGAEVRLFIDDELVATVYADLNGRYSASIEMTAGSHLVTAAVVGDNGRLGDLSEEVAIEVGKAADVLSRLDYADVLDDLAGIYLTDTHVLTISSVAQMQTLLRDAKDTLEKIEGGYSFQFFSGTTNNRTVTYYDEDGIATTSVTSTLSNGVLIRETIQHYEADAPYAKEVFQYNITGQTYTSTYQAYDANGLMVVSSRIRADGTLEYRATTASNGEQHMEYYNAAGEVTSSTFVHAANDGSGLSKEVYTYQITGQAYASTYQAYDLDGTRIDYVRSRADGSMEYRSYIDNEGQTISISCTASGTIISRAVLGTDGITTTDNFDSAGQLTSHVTAYPDKSSETLSYSAGVLTSKVILHAPGGEIYKESYTYNITGQVYTSTYMVYDANKKLIVNERYHADGSLDYAYYVNSDGSTVTRKYDTSGVITSDNTVLADKTTDNKTFTAGVITKETITYPAADENGVLKLVYEFNIVGKTYESKLSTYDASGKLIKVEYYDDPVVPTPLSGSAPEAPAIDFEFVPGSGELEATNAPPALTGTASDTGTAMLYDNGTLIGTATVDSALTFSFDLSTLSHGAHSLVVKMSNSAGRVSQASNSVVVNVERGTSAADEIVGSTGSDWMFGGDGDDAYIVNNAGDIVIEEAAGGTDTVTASVSFALSSFVENLVLAGPGNLTGLGNALDNGITGNAGDNRLNGGAGADRMEGMAGDDTFVVDHVGDLVVEGASEGTDRVLASISYTLTANIEDLTLTGSTAINGTGNDLSNTLTGNEADNTLDGRAGADLMVGGAGNDTYVVDNAGDVLEEATDGGGDAVRTSVSFTLAANLENMVLIGPAIAGYGNELANDIRGNAGANTLDGEAGADRLEGRLGDDIYVVDNRSDKVVEYAGQGYDTIRASVIYTLAANVEKLVLTGTLAINGTGNGLDNTLFGNSAKNTLTTFAGSDMLDGRLGMDMLTGGAGSDTFMFTTELGRTNVDTIADMKAGVDTIWLSGQILAELAAGTLRDAAFKDIGTLEADANDRILYDSLTGNLFYDVDGSGGEAAIKFATLTGKPEIQASDFLIG